MYSNIILLFSYWDFARLMQILVITFFVCVFSLLCMAFYAAFKFFTKTAEVFIEGQVVEMHDMEVPILLPHQYQNLDFNPMPATAISGVHMSHIYSVDIETDKGTLSVELAADLFQKIKDRIRATNVAIKINCEKLLWNGELTGKELLLG